MERTYPVAGGPRPRHPTLGQSLHRSYISEYLGPLEVIQQVARNPTFTNRPQIFYLSSTVIRGGIGRRTVNTCENHAGRQGKHDKLDGIRMEALTSQDPERRGVGRARRPIPSLDLHRSKSQNDPPSRRLWINVFAGCARRPNSLRRHTDDRAVRRASLARSRHADR